MYPQLFPTTEAVDAVFLYIFSITLVILIAVAAAIVYLVVRFHHKRNPKPITQASNSVLLETTWTIIPTLIALSMFYYGWASYAHLRGVPENAMEVTVTGRMWSWAFEYENGRITDRLYVPVNRPVKVRIRSADVIHSFYVPAFRVKKDAVPGMETYVWFVAPQVGSYDVFCAEYCGVGHADMITTVEALTEQDFVAWYAKELPEEDEGRQLLSRFGCLGCHSLDGSPGVGPTLQGLYGSRRTVLVNGQVRQVTADEEYLRRSIYEPNAEIVQGFPPVMPSYTGQIGETEMATIIEFLRELSE